jgi:DinB superfamily
MFTPDTKDWTWVLDRPCPECGFDASTCQASAVAGLARANAAEWMHLLGAGMVRAGRPEPTTWSSLEYACHVRDVYVRYAHRIALMVAELDPLYPNWDQDASAEADLYDDQDAATVVTELGRAANALTAQLDSLTPGQWERPGRRSDGASFTVATLARYMIHDPIHHVWDVTRQGREPQRR